MNSKALFELKLTQPKFYFRAYFPIEHVPLNDEAQCLRCRISAQVPCNYVFTVFCRVGELSDNGLQNNAPNGDTGDKTNLLDANATPTTLSAATSTKSLTGVSVEGGRSRDDERKRRRIQRL
jgi:hypothetical protein